MMDRKFYNDDFEKLIRQKTDQYKMYPSEKAWKGIYNSLHTKRRRFIAGMSVLIIGFLIIAGKELLTPAKHLASTKKSVLGITQKPSSADATTSFKAFNKESFVQAPSSRSDNGSENINQFTSVDIVPDQQENKTPAPSDNYNYIDIPSANSTATLSSSENLRRVFNNSVLEKTPQEISPDLTEASDKAAQISVRDLRKENIETYNESDKKQINWLQENATQHLTPVKQHRFNLQLYVSPTVNYRKLSGVDYSRIKSTIQNVPIALIHFGNVNDFVDHTPAVGYEVGGSMLYKLTRNLTLKAGFQFNYSRYIIKAFSANPELATITLNSYYGYLADSITGYTNVRNFGGKSRENLQNKYYQLSVPIGLEMRVIGNGKLQFNVAGTIQPTYLLNRNSYLLTTDYLNYTKEPSLFRRWNINGGLEAFLSYQIGGLRWQLGPQFRYQLLSTYTNKYPFKENLMEYGIKIGVSKTIR
ncbi:MAG: hypothetical protein JST75_16040 [Bacteroidetes bacterium]|nr:hypothetical protein [Bacteroidota bacterium]